MKRKWKNIEIGKIEGTFVCARAVKEKSEIKEVSPATEFSKSSSSR